MKWKLRWQQNDLRPQWGMRERDSRGRDGCKRNEEEGRAIRVLACSLNITDRFSVGKMLMKWIVSLIYLTNGKFVSKKVFGGNFIIQIQPEYPSVKKEKKIIINFYFIQITNRLAVGYDLSSFSANIYRRFNQRIYKPSVILYVKTLNYIYRWIIHR